MSLRTCASVHWPQPMPVYAINKGYSPTCFVEGNAPSSYPDKSPISRPIYHWRSLLLCYSPCPVRKASAELCFAASWFETGVDSVRSSANPNTCLACSKRFLRTFFARMFSVPIALDGALASARRIWVEMARLQAIPRVPGLLLLLLVFSSSDSSENEIDFVAYGSWRRSDGRDTRSDCWNFKCIH